MRRSRGIKLLVGILALFTAWILWSSHPFFMSPKLRYKTPVPAEAQRLIEEWFVGNKLGEPLPISKDGLMYLLAHPYDASGSNYDVTRESDDAIRVIRFDDVVFRIVRNGGKWEEVHIPKPIY